MIDNKLTEYINKIQALKLDLDNLVDEYSANDSVDEIIYSDLAHIGEVLETYLVDVEYYSKDTEICYLKKNKFAKFDALSGFDGKCLATLHCGSALELYAFDKYDECDKWFIGRVEHNKQKGYYFCCEDLDNPALHDGMRVRVRK